jgi:hypothetical protein
MKQAIWVLTGQGLSHVCHLHVDLCCKQQCPSTLLMRSPMACSLVKSKGVPCNMQGHNMP